MIAETQLEGGGVSGKYTWDSVLYHISEGDYATEYAVGDMIPLDLGSEGLINMQIAAFDSDDLADDSGKAHITFISKEVLKTKRDMNPMRTGPDGNFTEGTGSVGGWEKCEMRAYLNETVKPLISSDVRAAIRAVHKTHPAYNSADSQFTQTTDDEVWLPSEAEVRVSSSTPQPKYSALFPDKASLVKKDTDSSTYDWWSRSAGNASWYFISLQRSGDIMHGFPSNVCGVVLCFCL